MKVLLRKLLACALSLFLLAGSLTAPSTAVLPLSGIALAESQGQEASPASEEQTPDPAPPSGGEQPGQDEAQPPAPSDDRQTAEPSPASDGETSEPTLPPDAGTAEPEGTLGSETAGPTTLPDSGAGDPTLNPAGETTEPTVDPGAEPTVDPGAESAEPTVTPDAGLLEPTSTPEAAAEKALIPKADPASVTLRFNDEEIPENKKTFDLGEGLKTFTLTAVAEPADATIKWSASPSKQKVVTLSPNSATCTVTVKTTGTVTITATISGTTTAASLALTVVNLVQTVAINGAAQMPESSKLQLAASALPATAANRAVTWSIPSEADRTYASVNSKGVVTSKVLPPEAEPVTITVRADSADAGPAYDEHEIKIVHKATGIEIAQIVDDGDASAITEPWTLDRNDNTLKLKATVSPTDANQTVTWSSSTPKIAKIDAAGNVTFLATGTVTFTAKATDGSNKSKTTSVLKIIALANDVKINNPGVVRELTKTQLSALVTPSTTANKAVTWSLQQEGDYAKLDLNKGILETKDIPGPGRVEVTVTATAKDGSGMSDACVIEIAPMATAVDIQLDNGSTPPATFDMNTNEPMKLKAVVTPSGAIQDVTWSSVDTKTALIDQTGAITFRKAGTAKFTATAKDGTKKYDPITILVKAVSKEVQITGPESIPVGNSVTLKAAVLPATTQNKTFQWEVSEEYLDYATITSKGVLTAKKLREDGEPIQIDVIAWALDGSEAFGLYRPWIVPRASDVTIQLADGSDLPVDPVDRNATPTMSLKAVISPKDALQSVVWTSSNTKVAKFTAPGELSLIGTGTSTITAAATDGSGKKNIPSYSLKTAAYSKTVGVTGPATVTSGKTATFTATVGPAATTNKAVTWSLMGEEGENAGDYATISPKGVLAAKSAWGDEEAHDVTVVATAVDDGHAVGEWKVKLLPKPTGAEILYLGDKGQTIAEIFLNGVRTIELSAQVLPAAASQNVKWTSSNPKIATVSVSGNTCTVRAVKKGTATITATPVDGGKAATFAVKVFSGLPDATITVIPVESVVKTGSAIEWNVVTTGFDPEPVLTPLVVGSAPNADPIYEGGLWKLTPAQSGVYRLRLQAADPDDPEEGLPIVGISAPVTVLEVRAGEAGELKLGGVKTGKYASIGPDQPLPAGITVEYDPLERKSGASVNLTLEGSGSVRTLSYEELGLGDTVYDVGYRVLRGATVLFSGICEVTVSVVEEDNLPSGLSINPSTFTGFTGQDIVIPPSAVRLSGGTLLPEDLDYSVWDETTQVSDGPTIQFDEPGRYLRTLQGEYNGTPFTCNVTFIVKDAETQQPFEILLDTEDRTLYTGTIITTTFALLSTDATLLDGETMRWTLQRTDTNKQATAGLSLESATGATNKLKNGWSTGTGDVTFRITATSTLNSAYTAFTDVTMTLKPKPGSLPTGIEHAKGDHFTLPVGGALRIDRDDITAVGGAFPEGTEFYAVRGTTPPVYYQLPENGKDAVIAFPAAGPHQVTLTARAGNLTWSCVLWVTVDPAIDFPVLTGGIGESETVTLYRNQGGVGTIGSVYCGQEYVEDSGRLDWDVDIDEAYDDAIAVHAGRAKDSNFGLTLTYTKLGGTGEINVPCTVTCVVDGDYSVTRDFTIAIKDAPEEMPESIRYAPAGDEGVVRLDEEAAGEQVTLLASHVEDENGDPLPAGWKVAFDAPKETSPSRDAVTGDTTLYPAVGRYRIGITATKDNLVVKGGFAVIVGDGMGTIPLGTYLRIDTLYPSGSDSQHIGTVFAENLVLEEGEHVDWSVERINGEAVNIDKEDNSGEFYVNLELTELKPVAQDQTARFKVTCYVNSSYQGSTEFDLTVKAEDPTGMPTGLEYRGAQDVDIDVGESVVFDWDDFEGVGKPLPAGFWTDLYGIPESSDVYDTADACIVTFNQPGRYLITPAAGYQNCDWTAKPVAVNVGNLNDGLTLTPDQDFTTAYLDSGIEDGFFGSVVQEGAVLRDGETADWTIERIIGSGIELYKTGDDNTNAWFNYRIPSTPGKDSTVTYRVTYSAAGGRYNKHCDFTVNTFAETPEGAPNGSKFADTPVELKPGQTHFFARSDILYTLDGVVIAAPVGNHRRPGFGLTDPVNALDWRADDLGLTVTFPDPGRYVIFATAFYGNYVFESPIVVLVKDEENPALRLDEPNLDYSELYVGARPEGRLGSIRAVNFGVEDGTACNWSIERTDGNDGEPVALEIGYTDGAYADIEYRLGEGTGDVTYRITLQADGMTATANISVSVRPLPGGLPTGISLPCETSINLDVGGTLAIDFDQITFDSGTVPAGYEDKVWKDVWTEDGRWDEDAYWDHDDETNERVFHFNKAGRYLLRAGIGVCNYAFSKPIVVVVRKGNTGTLDPELRFDPRFGTAYLDSETSQTLAFLWVENAVLGDQQEDYHWSFEKISGPEGVAEIFEREEGNGPYDGEADYHLLGGTGTVTYQVTYTALNGLYRGTCNLTLTVKEHRPDGLPTAITLPQYEFPIQPGGHVDLDLNAIGYEGGTIPKDMPVWKEIWNGEGRWDSVGEDWPRDGVRRSTFPDEGVYYADVVLGVGNYMLFKTIKVIVKDGDAIDPDLNVYQRFNTAYLDGENDQNLGYVSADNVTVRDGEWDDFDYQWDIVPVGEENLDIAELTLEGEGDPRGVGIHYLLGDQPGTVTYEVRYTAGDLYEDSVEISLTVEDGSPEFVPTGITGIKTLYPDVAVGGSVSLDLEAIQPVGVEPDAEGLWREFWNAEGNWGETDENWEGSVRTTTFRREGVYYVDAVCGIDNCFVKMRIKIVVKDGNTIDPGLNPFQRFTTAYLDCGEKDQSLGYVSADNVTVPDGEWDSFDYEWEIDPVGEENTDIAELTLEGEGDPRSVGIHYTLGDQPGTVKYEVRYTAEGGLYKDSVQFTLNVAAGTPENVPTGITGIETLYPDVAVNGSVSLDLKAIQPVGVEPDAEGLWREFWNAEGNWGETDENWDETVRTTTFHHAGVYYVNAVCGIGNCFAMQSIKIVVKDGDKVDPGLNFDRKFATAYLKGVNEGYLGHVNADNVTVRDGEWDDFDYQWDIVPVGEENLDIAELTLEGEGDPRGVGIHYLLGDQPGTVTYEVRYTAEGDLYKDSVEISLTVADGALTGLPEGVQVTRLLYDDVEVGGTLRLDTQDIQPVGGSESYGGARVWREYWNAEGDWGRVDENWEDEGTVRVNTFNAAGQYYVNAVYGVDNYIFMDTIKIVVGLDAENHLPATLHPYQRYTTAYADVEEKRSTLAFVNVEGVTLREDEQEDFHWDIQKTEGPEGVIKIVEDENDDGAKNAFNYRVDYELLGGAGDVTFEVTYTALDDLYRGRCELKLHVAPNKPTGLPTAITMTGGPTYTCAPGGSIDLDLKDIQYVDGSVSQGTAWKEFWNGEGDWGSVEETWPEEGLRRNTFPNAGIYEVTAVCGVGNYTLHYPMTVIVKGEGSLNPGLNYDPRYTTLYQNGEEESWLGEMYSNAVVRPEKGEEFEWSIEPLDGADAIVKLTLDHENESPGHISVNYKLVEGAESGPVAYKVTYKALEDDLYFGEYFIDLNIEQTPGVVMPENLEIENWPVEPLTVGDSFTFDTDNIQPVGDFDPSGATVWKDYWYANGDWYLLQDRRIDETSWEVTFPEAGRYFVDAVFGIGNCFVTQRFELQVETEEGSLIRSADLDLLYSTLYTGVAEEKTLGHASLTVITLNGGEDYNWQVRQVTTGGKAAVDIGIGYSYESYATLTCLPSEDGTLTGPVEFEIEYTAAGTVYEWRDRFTVNIVEGDPEYTPDNFNYPYQGATIVQVGDTLAMDRAEIEFSGYDPQPSGDDVWKRYSVEGGDFESLDYEEQDGVQRYTFKAPTTRDSGPYRFLVQAGIGNWMLEDTFEVVVVQDKENIDPGLHVDLDFTTMYLSGGDKEGSLGFAWTEVAASGSCYYNWSVTPDGENGPGAPELSTEDDGPNDTSIRYILPEDAVAGTYEYTVSYSAMDGQFVDSKGFTLTVSDQEPGFKPEGIALNFDGLVDGVILAGPGETLRLRRSDIGFTNGPAPADAYTDIWRHDGDWDRRAEAYWEGNEYICEFREPGRYLLKAMIGLSNFRFEQVFEIDVVENGIIPVPGSFEPLYDTFYTGVTTRTLLGYAHLDFWPAEDQDFDHQWTVMQTSPEAKSAFKLELVDLGRRDVAVYCSPNPGGTATGLVKFELHFTAAKGLYDWKQEVEAEIVSGLPPVGATGIKFPYDSGVLILKPGEEMELNPAQILFTGVETQPTGAWTRYTMVGGDFGEAEVETRGGIDYYSFPEVTDRDSGPYRFLAQAGVGNLVWEGSFDVLVVEDKVHPDPGLHVDVDFNTLYTTGSPEGELGFAWVNAALPDVWIDDDNWSIEPDGGNAVGAPELSLRVEGSNGAGIKFTLPEVPALGTFTYHLTFQTPGGKFSAEQPLTVTVTDQAPEFDPQGIELSFDGLEGGVIKTEPDTVLRLSRDDVKFDIGQAPEGVAVFRDIWFDHGDEVFGTYWEDSELVVETYGAGRGFFKAVVAIGNLCRFEETFEIRSLEDGQLTMSGGFAPLYNTLYTSVTESKIFGYGGTGGVTLAEGEEYEWTVTQVTPGEAAAFRFEPFADAVDNLVLGVFPNEAGTLTGDVKFRLAYDVDGLYHWHQEFTVHIVSGAPAVVPTGITFPQAEDITVQAGEPFTLDNREITFTGGGAQPTGSDVWTNYTPYQGPFALLHRERDGVTTTYTISEPTTFKFIAQGGIGNQLWEEYFTVTVE